MRRLVCLTTILIAAGALPTVVYEALQKTSECIGTRTALLQLSADAERRVPWRPRTGVGAVDHAEHELAETRLFWQLTAQRAWELPSTSRRNEATSWSAFSLAVELVDR